MTGYNSKRQMAQDKVAQPAQELDEAAIRADEREKVMAEPLTKAMWEKYEANIRADEREEILKLADSLGWVNVDDIRARGNT